MKYHYLNEINSPEDLKKLSVEELTTLAEELRDYIIGVVSQTGGHLAPSLGTVELTLALHSIFESPADKIIWDVGHQAYAHKIVTGRREAFTTNRCWEGISGFPKPSESPHDAFGVGHASTSISAGFGMVCARDILKEDYHVVSVIGDGAFTGGLALEGLNNAGASGKDFIVVLNDNLMSISPNVGALHNYLTMMMTHPAFKKIKDEIWDITGKLPSGDFLQRAVGKIDSGLKSMMTPGALFEEMGFRYLGPVNGHDIERLVKILRQMKELKGPQILHIITQKGRGYKFAEENSTRFHGLGAFDKTTGAVNGSGAKAPSYTTVFGKTMVELAAENEKIVGISAAMAEGTGLSLLNDEFPERFYDVGIAEAHAVTF
ncbi:MAG: 1-deoxy-D-xylulose-5-phosphate synthase, partial [FCB group bacterium]|nr:1-deoxy-D-xylulose-5-phosphate synthase [FCB group bacterium]